MTTCRERFPSPVAAGPVRRFQGGKLGRYVALTFTLVVGMGGSVAASETVKIRDNSFLIEEAYNQEPGVIQHILAFQHTEGGSWGFTFTDEWPAPREAHQLSATIPVDRLRGNGTETGIGDVLLNYRYQLLWKDPVALSPRLSLILPTGDEGRGLGEGTLGFQGNIPLSVELTDRWVTHWNLGMTYVPRARGPGGAREGTYGFNYGASAVFLVSENFNFLVEAAGESTEAVTGIGITEWESSFFLNPGARFAWNHASGLQVVPGIGIPIGVGPSRGEYGVFLYLSFEHPLF